MDASGSLSASTSAHPFSTSALTATLPSLTARARRLARSRADADDLVQETVLRALRFEATFERGTNLRAWLHRILDSVFITRCRSRSREYRAMDRFASDPTLSEKSSRAPSLSLVSNEMHRALGALPAKYLAVVQLVDLADHSYREAAEELGIPVGTVMSRLFRARRMLEESFAPKAAPATAVVPVATTTRAASKKSGASQPVVHAVAHAA